MGYSPKVFYLFRESVSGPIEKGSLVICEGRGTEVFLVVRKHGPRAYLEAVNLGQRDALWRDIRTLSLALVERVKQK